MSDLHYHWIFFIYIVRACGSATTLSVSLIVVIAQICTNGALHFIGGPVSSAGKMEVCTGGEWVTVCGHSWDNNDAKVVCRQLGYPVDTPGACKWHVLCNICNTTQLSWGYETVHGMHVCTQFTCLLVVNSPILLPWQWLFPIKSIDSITQQNFWIMCNVQEQSPQYWTAVTLVEL